MYFKGSCFAFSKYYYSVPESNESFIGKRKYNETSYLVFRRFLVHIILNNVSWNRFRDSLRLSFINYIILFLWVNIIEYFNISSMACNTT